MNERDKLVASGMNVAAYLLQPLQLGVFVNIVTMPNGGWILVETP